MRTLFNFRDLGGIVAEDGRKVKKGLLFRSGNWDNTTEEDIEFLKSLNIKNVFDYRDNAEVPSTAPYDKAGVKYNHYPTASRTEKLLKLQKAGLLKKIRATVTYEDMAITYANLPFDNPGYEAMVEAIKTKDVPLLQHCFAGKDRAGVGVAIALMVLGVSREEIMKDYLASKEYEKEFLFLPMRWLPAWIRKIALKRGEVLFTVDPMLLNATFDAIDAKYGDTNTFLKEEYGLNPEDLTEIRDYYLEN